MEYFMGYFDDLWLGAEILKEGAYVDQQRLNTLATKFNIEAEGDNGP
jgi:hypothetical protein